jgi:nucleoside-diphosphate-sugar epimerase
MRGIKSMLKVGILGASGFIGSRCTEMFHLTRSFTVVPIVRNYGGLARIARFDLEWRIADGCDVSALQAAFTGCDAIVSCIVGDPDIIVRSAEACYEAAEAAGVRRLVYLSSMAVHGPHPSAGTNEETPLSIAQPLAYGRAKVRAERKLRRLRQHGKTELVVLRPGIVFGPRSRWITDLCDQLSRGTAYLIDGGTGICNSVYVDNLVEAVKLSITQPNIDGQTFFVSDAEKVTWWHFYSPFAEAAGVAMNDIACLPATGYVPSISDMAGTLRASKAAQAILPLVPRRIKSAVKAAIRPVTQENTDAWLPAKRLPSPSLEMTLLQQCSTKLESPSAGSLLGYKPHVSFEEGCKRSISWLQFCGYSPSPRAAGNFAD